MFSKIIFMKCKYKKAFSGVSKIRKFVMDKPALKLESAFQTKIKEGKWKHSE